MPNRALPRLPDGFLVDRDAGRLATFSRDASGMRGAAPIAVVRPRESGIIPDLVRWAVRHEIPLVPVSSPNGPRRGGDTLASRASVILDLSGFDRVRMADGRDHIALIEPGVTFAALDQTLRQQGLRAYRPLMPRAGKSALASYLDREPITSPAEHWDSGDPLSAVEVVFGDGSTFRTGGASVPGKLEDNLAQGMRFMVSLGPVATDFGRVLQGAQGALGIVTWGTVYCEPLPALEEARCFGSETLEPLLVVAERLCRRRLPGQLFIVNAVQAAMMMSNSRESFDVLLKSLPQWMLYLNHGVPDYLPQERMAYERRGIERDAEVGGLQSAKTYSDAIAGMLYRAQRDLRAGSYKDLPLGSHTEFYYLSQLDRTGKQISDLDQRSDPLGIYIQPLVHGVNCHVELTWLHSGSPEAARRVGDTMQRAVAACVHNGAFISRPKAPWGEAAFAADPAIIPFLKDIKRMFDPAAIFAPGRLCF